MEKEMKINSTFTKIIYKKPKVLLEDLPDRKTLLNNLENIIDAIISKNNSTIQDTSKEKIILINYPQIYNNLFIISNKNQSEFLKIYSEISILITTKIQFLLSEITIPEDKESFETELKKLMKVYKICQTLTELVTNLTLNNNSRFQSSLVLNLSPFNTNSIFISYLDTNLQIFSQRLQNYIDSSYDIYKDNFIITIFNFLQGIGARNLFNQILENEREKIINFHMREFSHQLQNFNKEENFADFLNNYDIKIQNIVFDFKILFGEHNAGTLKDKLMSVVFMDNLTKILNNESIMDSMWNKTNLNVLNLIYNLMNKKMESLISFQNHFFNFFLEKFSSQIKIPQNVKEGLMYMEFLLEKITTLNEIFIKCFNKDRRIHLRLKETISLLTNYKNVKNMAMLCGIFINELMSRNVGNFQKIQEVLNNFSVILQSIEERDNFFLCLHKLMIKRISNMKFVKDNEIYLIKILCENFGNRQCFSLFRILQDLEKSVIHYDNVKESKNFDEDSFQLFTKGNFNLFSFNAINQNDLIEIIQNKESNCLMKINNIISSKYAQQYPHRIITVSQNLSTCILLMLIGSNQAEILVNYIQANILLILNVKNKSIKLEELVSSLEVKGIYMTSFRSNLMSLISSGLILIKNKPTSSDNTNANELLNSDELYVNLSYLPGKNFINLTNIMAGETQTQTQSHNNKRLNNTIDELGLTRDHTSQSDIHALETSIESQSSVYLANKSYIIDCRITKILKNYKEVEHNQLNKLLLGDMKKFFSESNMPEVTYFQFRIDNLIERSIITRNFEENKIIYRFS